jgi:hypothetical protein
VSWRERGLGIGTSYGAGVIAEQTVLECPPALPGQPHPLAYLLAAALESSQKVFDQKRFRRVVCPMLRDGCRDWLIVACGKAERTVCSQQWR